MTSQEIVQTFMKLKPDDILKEVKAFFQLPVLPEYLQSEMLTAACYRALGFEGLRDNWISLNGLALTKIFTKKNGVESHPFNKGEVWKILKDVLLSPEDPKQRRTQKYSDFFFLAPIVPFTAYFSNPVRLKRNPHAEGGTPWNVELLFKAIVAYSSKDKSDADELWNELFLKLGVENGSREDYFAKIVESVLCSCASAIVADDQSAKDHFPPWIKRENSIYVDGKYLINEGDRAAFSDVSPLDEIRNGLRIVLSQKQRFSRWQWMTMFDAQMRMSVVALVLWLLDLHHVIDLAIVRYVIEGVEIPSVDSKVFFESLYQENRVKYVFCYGEGFAKAQKLVVTRYAREHLRLAFFLLLTKQIDESIYKQIDWSSIDGFVNSLRVLQQLYIKANNKDLYRRGVVEMLDEKIEDLNPKKSRLKHILEFFTVLRQKAVVDSQSDFMRYDQSYLVHKKGNYSSSPFVVDLGSMACFTIVSCCANGRRVFPLKELYKYLERYYISVRDAHADQFVAYLKGLGLTMDSPDAGDGLMVCNPFYLEEN